MSARRKMEIELAILQAQVHRRGIEREVRAVRESFSPVRSLSGAVLAMASLLSLRGGKWSGDSAARKGLRALVIGYVLARRLFQRH